MAEKEEKGKEVKEAKDVSVEDKSALTKIAGKTDVMEQLGMKLPKDAQKKLAEIKDNLDKFNKMVLKKFDKYVAGVALLPPRRPKPEQFNLPPTVVQTMPQQEQKEDKELINVLVLIDDSDSKTMSKFELKAKLGAIIEKMAKEVNAKLAPQTVILSELWESCCDGKYEILQDIAMSAPVFDRGMLAAIKIAEIHKMMVLKKFERYIVSYVLAGSLIQGKATEKSDIDVFIVIDDTDVKRMTRIELKDKLRAIIIGMAIEAGELAGIKNKLNVQVYILTDFWDSIKEANPIIFTFLRDGVPFYDRGIFMPWKQLLRMGKVKPSTEAIDLYMSTGDQMLKRAKFKITEIGLEDTFWAILTPSQAALMLYGVPPPTPKETPGIMREIFVRKEKMLEEEYIKILEENIELRKKLEHGEKKDLTGKEVDRVIKNSEKYLKRIDKLFSQIEKRKLGEDTIEVYDGTLAMIREVLKAEGVSNVVEAEIVSKFEDKLISPGKVPAKYLRTLNEIIKTKKDYDAGKLTKAELEKIKKDSQHFSRFLLEFVQRKRGKEIEKASIRVKYGEKYGQVFLLDKDAFIIEDIDAEEKQISKAKLNEDGSLGKLKKSDAKELEKALAETKIPEKVFIKEPIFEDLKKIFSKEVEVLISYV